MLCLVRWRTSGRNLTSSQKPVQRISSLSNLGFEAYERTFTRRVGWQFLGWSTRIYGREKRTIDEILEKSEGPGAIKEFESLSSKEKSLINESNILKMIRTYLNAERPYNAVQLVELLYDLGYTSQKAALTLKNAGLDSILQINSTPNLAEKEICQSITSLIGIIDTAKTDRTKWLHQLFTELTPLKYTRIKLMESYSHEGYFDDTIELFKQLENPPFEAYTSLIRALLGKKEYKDALNVVYEIRDKKMILGDSLIQTLLDCYIADGDFNKSWKIYQLMEETETFISERQSHSLLMMCGNKGKLTEAKNLYEKLKKTEASIIVMANVARLCGDKKLEKKLWEEKILLTDQAHSLHTEEDKTRQSDVINLVIKRITEQYQETPSFITSKTTTEGTQARFFTQVKIGKLTIASAEAKQEWQANLNAAFRVLERLKDPEELDSFMPD